MCVPRRSRKWSAKSSSSRRTRSPTPASSSRTTAPTRCAPSRSWRRWRRSSASSSTSPSCPGWSTSRPSTPSSARPPAGNRATPAFTGRSRPTPRAHLGAGRNHVETEGIMSAESLEKTTRVVLTGFGVFSSIGVGAEEFAAGLRAGRSGARPISVFDTEGFPYANGCEVPDFEPERWIHRLDPAELGRASQFSVAAARMAVMDAGFDLDALRASRGLISIGTTDGESYELDRLVETDVRQGPRAMDPVIVRRVPASRLSVAIARELELSNVEATTIATACSAGNYSIGYGFDAVRAGEVDYAICGGADAMCRKTFTGFFRLGTIAPDVVRPFDKDRKGILTGEGAGVLVLESLD